MIRPSKYNVPVNTVRNDWLGYKNIDIRARLIVVICYIFVVQSMFQCSALSLLIIWYDYKSAKQYSKDKFLKKYDY